MSYRNDHDAALARIDALEAELGKTSDARARFSSLEEQLAQARRERDRAIADGTKRTSWAIPATLALVSVAIIGGLGFAASHASEPAPEHPIAVAPPVAPPPPSERTKLLACVAQLDAHVAGGEPSTPACLDTLSVEVADAGLGTDIHATLVAWRSAEWERRWSDRAALLTPIHTYIIPAFTR